MVYVVSGGGGAIVFLLGGGLGGGAGFSPCWNLLKGFVSCLATCIDIADLARVSILILGFSAEHGSGWGA